MSTLALMGAGPEASSSLSAFDAAVLALSPSLYWPLNDPSGTQATDISGNARHGTYGAAVTLNQASIETSGKGRSVSFDASASASISSTYNPFTGNLSIGLWCNPTNFVAQRNMFGGSNNTNGPAFGINAPFWFSDLAAASVGWVANDIAAAANQFVVLTWNNTKVSELFVGAVSKTQKTSVNAFNATPGNFVLGNFGTSAATFLGPMQGAFIVPSVLSSGQITTLFNAG
jgi:hypothetical protein